MLAHEQSDLDAVIHQVILENSEEIKIGNDYEGFAVDRPMNLAFEIREAVIAHIKAEFPDTLGKDL